MLLLNSQRKRNAYYGKKMKKLLISGGYIVLVMLAGVLIRCQSPYSPFSDYSRARIHVVAQTFEMGAKGSVEIFSRETLSCVVALPQLVDSCVVAIPNSRLGTHFSFAMDSLVRLSSPTFKINFSLVDTGLSKIALSTYRKNGEILSDVIWIKAISPLYQSPIDVENGTKVTFSSDSVKDKDVLYHWQIGSHMLIVSSFALQEALYSASTTDTLGYVWVSDSREKFISPKLPFVCSARDETPPHIERISPPIEYAHGDTIGTSSDTVPIAFRITDANSNSVAYVSFNGIQANPVSPDVYTYICTNIIAQTKISPFRLQIAAVDRFLNADTLILCVRYDSLAANAVPYSLSIISPSTDTSNSSAFSTTLFGVVRDFAHQNLSMNMVVIVNDSMGLPFVARGVGSALFSVFVTMRQGNNNILVIATDSISKAQVSLQRTILYSPGFADTISPAIIDVTINSHPANILTYEDSDSARIKVLAFDEGSGVEKVSINGVTAFPDTQKYVWKYTMPLKHKSLGNPLSIIVTDKVGKSAQQFYTIYKNAKPQIYNLLESPTTKVSSMFSDTFRIADPDFDVVVVSTVSLTCKGTWGINDDSIFWFMPAVTDTGRQSFTLTLFDGYEQVLVPYTVTCLPEFNRPPTLSLQSTSQRLTGDTLLLSAQTAFDTIIATITDPDSVTGEQFIISMFSNGVLTQKEIGTQKTFYAVLDRTKYSRQATAIIFRVEDAAGNKDSMRIYVTEQATTPVAKKLFFNTTPTGANVTSALYKFPLLVRVDTTILANASLARGGLVFTKKNGTELPYEVEKWDTVSHSGICWVLVDTILANCDTQYITAEWREDRSGNRADGALVFDTATGFAGVWHLGANATDATIYKNNGTLNGPPAVVGAIGTARSFNGSSQDITMGIPSNGSLNFKNGNYTFSTWYKLSSNPAQEGSLVSKCDYETQSGYKTFIQVVFGKLRYSLNLGASRLWNEYASNWYSPDTNWHVVTWVVNQTTRSLTCFLDGNVVKISGGTTQLGDFVPLGTLSFTNANEKFSLGSNADPGNPLYFSGVMDEAIVMRKAMSQDWIRLCYYSQKIDSSFITIR